MVFGHLSATRMAKVNQYKFNNLFTLFNASENITLTLTVSLAYKEIYIPYDNKFHSIL